MNQEALKPGQALDCLSQMTGIERPHLAHYFPELEGYKTGSVTVAPLEGGHVHVYGDLGTAGESTRYYAPIHDRFYRDHDKAIKEQHAVDPWVAPHVVELPQRLNVVLEREQQDEPVFVVREVQQHQPDFVQAEMPSGVIRAVIKRPPTQDEMMATFDDYSYRTEEQPEERHNLLLAMDHLGQGQKVAHYAVLHPELRGYRPTHLRQMSNALRARNPLYLKNALIPRRVGKTVKVEEALRIALWVAVGVLVGVLMGIYFR